ncbi:MAG: ankyrin repeat domain-containing protein [Pseudomonadota bacterium]|nr:ankyrin repeat domain-containing protein [Pseudomonadota bacterium]
MKRFSPALAALLLAAALTACTVPATINIGGETGLQHITVKGDRVGAKSADGSIAWIDADGALEIGGVPVELDAPQRELALRYHGEAMSIRAEGVAIGKSGVAMAGKSIGNVVRGLTRGEPDSIGDRIQADARQISDRAMVLCEKVGTLHSVQEELARALPAFAPYATMTGSETKDCTSQAASNRKPTQLDHDLLAAAEAGDIAAAKQLIEAGANVDTRIRGDGTALIIAARHGQLPMVEQLLQLGADVEKPSRGDGNPLIAAAAGGHDDVTERLLAAGADVDAVVAGDETPLINAARQGHLEIVKRLVAHGADVNLGVTADMGEYRSPLNQAKNDDVRDYLLSQGAHPQGGS